MGFSHKFIQFLYKNNVSFVINNGVLLTPIQLQGGLRQGCSLSLPLYVIQGEVSTVNINNNENIKGIKIPNNNKEIKISEYADDSNFLLTEQILIKFIISYIEKLNKATGSTINLEKTKVLPINTNQTFYTQKHEKNITILEQYQYIKISGIFFSEDLKDTILLNWENIKKKKENHIQKMSMRQVSLYGKSILINTLILTKTTFLSNLFPIPEKQSRKYIQTSSNTYG